MSMAYEAPREERPSKPAELPRSLRRAYRSRNEAHIQQEITKALVAGFTKEEIQADFAEWAKNKEFIE